MRATELNAPASLPCVPVARLDGHEGPVQAVLFTAEGKYCLTCGVDRTVRLWNPRRLDPAYIFPQPLRRRSESLHDNDNNDIDDIPLTALPPALPIQVYRDGLTHAISALAMNDDSTTLVAASDKVVVVTDVLSQQAKQRLHGHVGPVNAVAISQGSETFLSASYDATVRIWDGKSRSPAPIQILKDAKDSVTSVHVVQSSSSSSSSDNTGGQALIRTASIDGIVRTYDLRMGVMRSDNVGSPITSMAPTHDGQCLAISCLDGCIRLMELDSGELLNTYESHHTAGQYGLQCGVLADDATIVTGSEDGRVVCYDLVRATCVQSLVGPTRPTCAVACHPLDSHVAIAASYDGSTVVWANSGKDFMR